eukprot:11334795-Alexandrium_andersonii.AAC.1
MPIWCSSLVRLRASSKLRVTRCPPAACPMCRRTRPCTAACGHDRRVLGNLRRLDLCELSHSGGARRVSTRG